MQVFVTGATGYVGSSVATAFRRVGHRVWGLTRSEAKARRLAQQEIQPVIGDLANPKSYADVAAECAVLVHAAFEYSAQGVAKDKTAIEALVEAGRRGARPKTLIFTSGAWVHGDTGDRMVDETTPLNPVALVAWRPAHEQLVLQAPGVRGLVIRPGCVYGGPGGLTAPWFADASAGKPPTVVGDGRNRWTMVHADDLADAYLRVGESGLGGGRGLRHQRWLPRYGARDGRRCRARGGLPGRDPSPAARRGSQDDGRLRGGTGREPARGRAQGGPVIGVAAAPRGISRRRRGLLRSLEGPPGLTAPPPDWAVDLRRECGVRYGE
ncbi:MAG TPA: NAD-dependent epimerase/dehydratase family protein [Gemmatimonadales bacterium]|nr:NAD-dependent epimerase/dehydratase family protein [Gemmatimonadales bacterium]